MIIREFAGKSIEIFTDENFDPKSTDNLITYNNLHLLPETYDIIGVILKENEKIITSFVLGAPGCGVCNSNSSIVIGNNLFVCVGNHLFMLNLVDIQVKWASQLDFATCFAIYPIENYSSLIVHGECEISRVNLDGKLLWQTSGEDIFTGEISFSEGQIKIVDFNETKYQIEIENGKIKKV